MKLLQAIIVSLALALITTTSNSYAEPATDENRVSIPLVININTATQEELMQLKGIGETKAKAIISYRNDFGQFEVVEELLDVKGIGEKLLQQNRDRISL